MKIGIVGCGQAGTAHANAYKNIEGLNLAAIYDVNNEKTKLFSQKYNATPMEIDALISNVDIVDICVPTNKHLEIIKLVAKKGKDIICETPLATTLEEALEIMEICSENNVKLLPVHFHGMSGPLQKIRNMYLNNELSTKSMIRITRRNPLIDQKNWRNNFAESGGVILDLLIQDIAFLIKNIGPVVRIYAKSTYGQKDVGGEYALLSIGFANGSIAHLDGSWIPMNRGNDEFEFADNNSLVEFSEDKNSPLSITVKTEKDDYSYKESPINEDMYYIGFSKNIEALINEEEFTITLEDSIEILKVALSAIKSAQTGNVIGLD